MFCRFLKYSWSPLLGLLVVLACDSQAAQRRVAPSSTQLAPPIPHSQMRLVLLGDSIAHGTGDETGTGLAGILAADLLQKGIETSHLVNLARDGARTVHVLAQLRDRRVRPLLRQADLIVLSIGANDLFVDSSRPGQHRARPQEVSDRVLQRLDLIVTEIREVNPRAQLVLIALYNPFFDSSFGTTAGSFVQGWNSTLRARYGTRENIAVIETFDVLSRPDRLSLDRLHPNAEGYRRIAERIAEVVR